MQSIAIRIIENNCIYPIAVGEDLRRSKANCLAKEANSESINILKSLQKLGSRSEGRRGIHWTKRCTKCSPLPVHVFCKLVSAMHSILKCSRTLKAVANSMPGIAAFTDFCYSQHSRLFYDKFVISSESGTKKTTHWA